MRKLILLLALVVPAFAITDLDGGGGDANYDSINALISDSLQDSVVWMDTLKALNNADIHFPDLLSIVRAEIADSIRAAIMKTSRHYTDTIYSYQTDTITVISPVVFLYSTTHDSIAYFQYQIKADSIAANLLSRTVFADSAFSDEGFFSSRFSNPDGGNMLIGDGQKYIDFRGADKVFLPDSVVFNDSLRVGW